MVLTLNYLCWLHSLDLFVRKKREIIGPNINWFFILFFRNANFNELQCCKTELIKKYLLAKNHKNHASSDNY